MKFRLLVHAEKELLADAERDKCYAKPKTSKVAIPLISRRIGPVFSYEPEARFVSRSGETLVIPPHSPAPMRALGGCGARGAEANS